MRHTGGCYLLTNRTGLIGCEETTDTYARAPLMLYEDLEEPLTEPRTIIVTASNLQTFLNQVTASTSLQSNIKGVLVNVDDHSTSFSVSDSFPLAAYAPYQSNHSWNPPGQSLFRQYFPFPMYRITGKLATEATSWAQYNNAHDYSGRGYVAEMYLSMYAKFNSSYCIANKQCSPLLNYNVMAASPPLLTDPAEASSMPITLVVAAVDGNDMFHDFIQASDGPLSGLIAMVAAVRLLSAGNLPSSSYQRRLVFMALSGEVWDNMGSRALMWNLYNNATATKGLDLNLVDQVLEVGQVGRAMSKSGSVQLYAHTQPGGAYGNASGLVAALSSAASQTSEFTVAVSPASASNPGLPPSSLYSFLRVKPAIQGVVLAEYDSAFLNPYFASEFDNLTQINTTAITAAALVLARTLYSLAFNGAPPSPLQVNSSLARVFVTNLTTCLMTSTPGMNCWLATRFIVPGYTTTDGEKDYSASHYVGTKQYPVITSATNVVDKPDVTLFLWNLLANWTAVDTPIAANTTACDMKKKPCGDNQVCVGFKGGSNTGICRNASARFLMATSTRTMYYKNRWWVVEDPSLDAWEQQYSWPPDPMFCESVWPYGMPHLRVYMMESTAQEVGVLVSGLGITAVTAVLCYFGKLMFERHLGGRD